MYTPPLAVRLDGALDAAALRIVEEAFAAKPRGGTEDDPQAAAAQGRNFGYDSESEGGQRVTFLNDLVPDPEFAEKLLDPLGRVALRADREAGSAC